MPAALLISVGFPSGVYRGSDHGRPETLPPPARLHAAFVSAAGGGPAAHVNGRVLVADDRDRSAVEWLERESPIGVIVPESRMTEYVVKRYRKRVAVDVKERHDYHLDETGFESFSALRGRVVFAWPTPSPSIVDRLQLLAREITHVGGADSTVVVRVSEGEFDANESGALAAVDGRGPGHELKVPQVGRYAVLVEAHQRALERRGGSHGAGLKSKQAVDEPAGSARDQSTQLRRFAPSFSSGPWPFAEVWTIPVTGGLPPWALTPGRRVNTAVRVHRALVAAIGDDVPEFVSGRSGAGPLAGVGHLAVQFVDRGDGGGTQLILALPAGVSASEREVLAAALRGQPPFRLGSTSSMRGRGARAATVRNLNGARQYETGVQYWSFPSDVYATAVPMVLDAPGTPRHGPWSLDDAVLCSLGYALRGVLESDGVEWGSGWEFRQRLVSLLRERGADARAFRVTARASRFVHHARESDLLVAVNAVVRLGQLSSGGRGFLALGRSRHLGGGLLMPLGEAKQCL